MYFVGSRIEVEISESPSDDALKIMMAVCMTTLSCTTCTDIGKHACSTVRKRVWLLLPSQDGQTQTDMHDTISVRLLESPELRIEIESIRRKASRAKRIRIGDRANAAQTVWLAVLKFFFTRFKIVNGTQGECTVETPITTYLLAINPLSSDGIINHGRSEMCQLTTGKKECC